MGGVGRGRGPGRVSAIPTIAIASSPRPTDLSFDDLRYQRIPAMTSWVRLEGDLRARTSGGGNAYQLVNPADERSYVDVDTSQSCSRATPS